MNNKNIGWRPEQQYIDEQEKRLIKLKNDLPKEKNYEKRASISNQIESIEWWLSLWK